MDELEFTIEELKQENRKMFEENAMLQEAAMRPPSRAFGGQTEIRLMEVKHTQTQ